MKRPDILVLIAVWQFITAFFTLIGIAAVAIWGFSGAIYDYNGWGTQGFTYWRGIPVWIVFGLSFAILVLVCYMALSIAAGAGLLKGREWGRITSLVHSGLSLICIPFGTVIGALVIIYLTKQETRDYFAANKTKAVPPGSATPQ